VKVLEQKMFKDCNALNFQKVYKQWGRARKKLEKKEKRAKKAKKS
jgi:hypothetical protein